MSIANAILLTAINPIKGVNTPPPIIAITITDPAIFVFEPSPFIPKAKIVGYINDIKKLERKIVQTPIQPGLITAFPIRTILIIPYIPINFRGLM